MESHTYLGSTPSRIEKCEWHGDSSSGNDTLVEIHDYRSDTQQRPRPAPSDLQSSQTYMYRRRDTVFNGPSLWGLLNHWSAPPGSGAPVPHTASIEGSTFSPYLGDGRTAIFDQLVKPYVLHDWDELDGRIRDDIGETKVNLMQNFAEWRQSADLCKQAGYYVIDNFRSLANSHRVTGKSLRDQLIAPVGRKAKALAGLWLQIQYGIRPLLADLYASTEILAAKSSEGIWTPWFKKSNRRDFTIPYSNVTDVGGITVARVADFGGFAALRAEYRYKIAGDGMSSLAQWGISNPLELAWELIPYSFVIDQILPIGQYLDRMDSLMGIQDIQINRGRIIDCQSEFRILSKPCGFTSHLIKERMETNNVLGNPLPRLRTSRKADLSIVTQLGNMVALLTQLRG